MAIHPQTLETPERDMKLETRKEPGDRKAESRLRGRLEQLRTQEPPPAPKIDAYSKDWWARGWKAGWTAALEALEKD